MNERLAGWLDAARVYADRRVIAILFLGFSSGLPLLLCGQTLSYWISQEGASRTAVGAFALVGTAYTLKFLWSPIVDHLPLPWLTRVVGRRRSWALLSQGLVVVTLLLLGTTSPAENLLLTALVACAVAFSSATQDIVLDAYRIELLDEHELGAGAATFVNGYRFAILASGAGALFLSAAMDWFWVYAIMAGLMLTGIVTVLLSPEPRVNRLEVPAEIVSLGDKLSYWLKHSALDPFRDFMTHRGWLVILCFVVFYKFGDSVAGVMAFKFYVELGFTPAEVASVSKLFGFVATVLGAFAGGLVVARFGIMQSLLICGVLQMGSNLMFAVQASVGHSVPMLGLTIAVENVTGGMGTAAFVAYLSALCNASYTATQYALLSSFMAFARTWLSAPGGYVADQTNWITFFILTTVAAVPGLLLWWWLQRRGFVPHAEGRSASRPPDG